MLFTNQAFLDPTKRHNAIFIFDAADSNPNGDPDMMNRPRQDTVDKCGIVTRVSMNRHIRDVIDYKQSMGLIPAETNQILIRKNAVINDRINEVYKELGHQESSKGKKKNDPQLERDRGIAMHQKYVDLRLFGGVLSTGDNKAGVWTGPFQISHSKTVHPIDPYEVSITRCAATNEKESKDNKTMGNIQLLRYGLYKGTISYSPHLAVGVSQDDMKLFWESLVDMWDLSKSLTRTNIHWRGIWVFSHDNALGNCNEVDLIDRLSIKWDCDNPGKFSDFVVSLNQDYLPEGITLSTLV